MSRYLLNKNYTIEMSSLAQWTSVRKFPLNANFLKKKIDSKIVTIEITDCRPLKRNCIGCPQRVQIRSRWPFLAVDLMLPWVCLHSINSWMMTIGSAANELALNHMSLFVCWHSMWLFDSAAQTKKTIRFKYNFNTKSLDKFEMHSI